MTLHILRKIIGFVVMAGAVGVLIAQCRKPTWWPGRFYAWLMNQTHFWLTTWGLEHVEIGKGDTILDVGCGGGRTIQRLAAIANEGKVYGIDYSPASVAVARGTNRDSIALGRVDVQLGSVSSLPFPDASFDLVTAVETHYYWPDPVNDLREILRVLKPGGRLLIAAEVYSRSEHAVGYPMIMKILGGRSLTVREQREQFAEAGYVDVETFENSSKGWFCGVAKKPA
ncbi:MAG TPA: methyltransferase domain-containing protein [Gemmatimonadaceae bacterium]|jgi:SAM-dependent methyltransferase|nr:methyltransferase domain-containing protein [Gemmatimonadaceae bacterium]